MLSLSELCSRVVAAHIAFEVVEQAWQPVPEPLQLRIAFWSFPDNEEDIRLYSCLANGAADEFNKGENLYKSRAVKEPLQIGNSPFYSPHILLNSLPSSKEIFLKTERVKKKLKGLAMYDQRIPPLHYGHGWW